MVPEHGPSMFIGGDFQSWDFISPEGGWAVQVFLLDMPVDAASVTNHGDKWSLDGF